MDIVSISAPSLLNQLQNVGGRASCSSNTIFLVDFGFEETLGGVDWPKVKCYGTLSGHC